MGHPLQTTAFVYSVELSGSEVMVPVDYQQRHCLAWNMHIQGCKSKGGLSELAEAVHSSGHSLDMPPHQLSTQQAPFPSPFPHLLGSSGV